MYIIIYRLCALIYIIFNIVYSGVDINLLGGSISRYATNRIGVALLI